MTLETIYVALKRHSSEFSEALLTLSSLQLYLTSDPFSNIDISTGFAISHVAISIFLGCLLFFATSLTGLSILKFGIEGNSIFIPYLIHK